MDFWHRKSQIWPKIGILGQISAFLAYLIQCPTKKQRKQGAYVVFRNVGTEALPTQLVLRWLVGWLLCSAGCTSQDNYLLYLIVELYFIHEPQSLLLRLLQLHWLHPVLLPLLPAKATRRSAQGQDFDTAGKCLKMVIFPDCWIFLAFSAQVQQYKNCNLNGTSYEIKGKVQFCLILL